MSTIRDVAREAGVALGTASYALNGTGGSRVNAETRQRVLAVARRLNFMPNVNARRLASKRSELFGIVLPSFLNRRLPIFYDRHLVDIFTGLEAGLSSSSYRMAMLFNDARFVEQKEFLTLFQNRTIDGMLVWGSCAGEEFWKQLKEEHYPCIFLTRPAEAFEEENYILHDYRAAGRMVMRHLCELGHRNVLWLGGNPEHGIVKDIEAGMQELLEEYPDLRLQCRYCGFCGENVGAVLQKLAAQNACFTALAGNNMRITEEAGRVLAKMDAGRVALASCDGVAEEEDSGITHIVVDDVALGQKACEAILALIDGRVSRVQELLPVTLACGRTSIPCMP